MQKSRLQEYICDYVDGTMDNQVRASFEQFIHENQILQTFVDAASQGKRSLRLLSNKSDDYRSPNQNDFATLQESQIDEARQGRGRAWLKKLRLIPPLFLIVAFLEYLRRLKN